MSHAKPAIIAFIALVIAPAPAESQAAARARATVTIGEVLSLRVQPGGGTAVLSADGVYRQLDGAVRLQVLANRPWDLHAVSGASGSRLTSLDGAGEAVSGLWWRTEEGEGDAFVRAEEWPVLVTSGSAGRTEIEVDYRWFDGSGRELQPGTTLHFTLSPR